MKKYSFCKVVVLFFAVLLSAGSAGAVNVIGGPGLERGAGNVGHVGGQGQ